MPIDSFDTKIRYFLKVADTASLSRAADDLGLSQPALSRNIAALEKHLGGALFARTGRGMKLTADGHSLVQAAGPAYMQIDTALSALREKKNREIRGTLKIAAIHTVNYYYASDLLARFVSNHSKVNVSILARSSPEVVYLVEKGKADIGFVYASAVSSDILESRPLFTDEMCLINRPEDLPDDGPVALSQLTLPLVAFPETYALRRMLKSADLNDHVVAEAETINAMLRLCSMGIGGCILPQQVPSSLLTDYGLRKTQLQPPGLRRRVIAIIRNDVMPGTLSRELLSMIAS